MCEIDESTLLVPRFFSPPPLLLVYDHAIQKYVLAGGNECVAAWASSTYPEHAAGQICGRPAEHEVGDVRLCYHHYKRTLQWRSAGRRSDLERHAAAFSEQRAAAAQALAEVDAERARLHRQRMVEYRKVAGSVVYYVRRADGLIKIGTTRRFESRMNSLAKEYGDLSILLVVPGSYDDEREAHAKFFRLRVHGEWFSPGRELTEWIRLERERLGPDLPHADQLVPPDDAPITAVGG